jgi:hypothetical protein
MNRRHPGAVNEQMKIGAAAVPSSEQKPTLATN